MNRIAELLDVEMARFVGCRPEDLRAGGVVVVPGQGSRYVLYIAADGVVVASDLFDETLNARLRRRGVRKPFGSEVIEHVLAVWPGDRRPERVSHDILFYCTAETFTPRREELARPVPRNDLFWEETDHPGIEMAFAVHVEDTRASTATVVDQGHDRFRAIGVGTKPEHRGRGYAKAVASAATRHVAEQGRVALWNTGADNLASQAVARAVGYREHGRIVKIVRGPRNVP